MRIRLVALDIDGTLLAPGAPVDALPGIAIVEAVARLMDSGVTVVLASGRMYPGTVSIARHLGIDQPLICQQGASVHEHNGSLRHACAIEETIAIELLDYASTNNWPLAWFDSERYLVTRHCEPAQFFADVSGVNIELMENPHLSGVRATGIDIISSVGMASRIHAELAARYSTQVSLLDFPSVTAVHAPAASKGNALQVLARELGIDAAEVLAVGDSVNDVSMLAWAGYSAAPEHCDRYARRVAKEILPGKGVEGVVARLQAVVG